MLGDLIQIYELVNLIDEVNWFWAKDVQIYNYTPQLTTNNRRNLLKLTRERNQAYHPIIRIGLDLSLS